MLASISQYASFASEIAINRTVKIWEHVIWCLIFSNYRNTDKIIESAFNLSCDLCNIKDNVKPSKIVNNVLRNIQSKFVNEDCILSFEMEDYIDSTEFINAKDKVIEISAKNPVIIAIDSLEKYSIENEPMMRAISSLIECASNFNTEYSRKGIHIKLFVSAEIFPHLCETEISNPAKYVRDPVYLHWKPKDLMRLISWRFNEYLKSCKSNKRAIQKDISWDLHHEVHENAWIPFFGRVIENARKLPEDTFPYILRHTQLRPRQFIIICNKMASIAKFKGEFPDFTRETIVEAVSHCEVELATEIINSYGKRYKNIGKIVRALDNMPAVFSAKDLDKVAYKTAPEWENKQYSPSRFKSLIADLGIVGKIRNKGNKSGIIEADFSYAMRDTLILHSEDECVIHPMFYKKLKIKCNRDIIVYPFPDHPDFKYM